MLSSGITAICRLLFASNAEELHHFELSLFIALMLKSDITVLSLFIMPLILKTEIVETYRCLLPSGCNSDTAESYFFLLPDC